MNRMSTQCKAYGLLTIEDYSLLTEGNCREKGDVEVMEKLHLFYIVLLQVFSQLRWFV